MAKVTEKLKLTLPSPEERIDIDVLNSNYETLESQIYSNLIKKKTSISEKSNFGEVIPPYVTITNTNLEAVNVIVGEEKIIIPAASTIAVAIKDKKELSIDTDGVIAVEYFISNERYASEQSGSAVDSELSEASENPVQNKVITAKFKEYYNSEEVNELIDGIGTPEDVYTKTETDNLLSAKAEKNNTYTKTETDNKITEKVSEIVSGAPEDFDTLKEMSDWLTEHEDSAATMNSAIQKNAEDIETANSAIQQNKTDILSANAEIAKKVDKVTGESLIADSEIQRLANVDNYDDTSVNAQIADIYNRCGGGKNLCPINSGEVKSASGGYAIGGNAAKQKIDIKSGRVIVSWNGTATTGSSEIGFFTGETKVISVTKTNKTSITFEVELDSDVDGINLYCNRECVFSDVMIRYADIKDDTYAPYAPTNAELQEQINTLTARIAALEGTGTTTE
jgi:hypothetical protein